MRNLIFIIIIGNPHHERKNCFEERLKSKVVYNYGHLRIFSMCLFHINDHDKESSSLELAHLE